MLPLGCDTLILEHLADDLSAAFRVLRAPTLEYGVSAASGRHLPRDGPMGGAVRKISPALFDWCRSIWP